MIHHIRAIQAALAAREAKEKADLMERVGLKASALKQRAIQRAHEAIVLRIAGTPATCPARAPAGSR